MPAPDLIATCIGCGCDDFHACVDVLSEPCHWLRVDRKTGTGVCSSCPQKVAEWDLRHTGFGKAENVAGSQPSLPVGSANLQPFASMVISVRQPWAWLLIRPDIIGTEARARAYAEGLIKDVENRDWPTPVRGRVLIHASKGMTSAEYEDCCDFVFDEFGGKIIVPRPGALQRQGIIGAADLTDCVTSHASPWFCGRFGFVTRNSLPLPFFQCMGQRGFFRL